MHPERVNGDGVTPCCSASLPEFLSLGRATVGCTPCDHTSTGWWPGVGGELTRATLLRLFPAGRRIFHPAAILQHVTTKGELTTYCATVGAATPAATLKFHKALWQRTLGDPNFYLEVMGFPGGIPSPFLIPLAGTVHRALHEKIRMTKPQRTFVGAAVDLFLGLNPVTTPAVTYLTQFGALYRDFLSQDESFPGDWLETAIAADFMASVDDGTLAATPIIPFAIVKRVAAHPLITSLEAAANAHDLYRRITAGAAW